MYQHWEKGRTNYAHHFISLFCTILEQFLLSSIVYQGQALLQGKKSWAISSYVKLEEGRSMQCISILGALAISPMKMKLLVGRDIQLCCKGLLSLVFEA